MSLKTYINQLKQIKPSSSVQKEELAQWLQHYYASENSAIRQDFIETFAAYLNITETQFTKLLGEQVTESLANINQILQHQADAKQLIRKYQSQAQKNSAIKHHVLLGHYEWIKVCQYLASLKLNRIQTRRWIAAINQAKDDACFDLTDTMRKASIKRKCVQNPRPTAGRKKMKLPRHCKPVDGAPAIVDANMSPQSKAKIQAIEGIVCKPLILSPGKSTATTPKGTKTRLYAKINQTYPDPNTTETINKRYTLFKPATPDHKKKRIHTPPTQARVKTQLFTATLASMKKNASGPRPCSQNRLMGKSCKQAFTEDDLVIEGKTHWSHLIAYYFGGRHNQDNLVAATAEANLNMLRCFERRIGDVLRQLDTDKVHIRSQAFYHAGNEVPYRIEVHLNWQVSTFKHAETLFFNPQSSARLSRSQINPLKVLTPKTLKFQPN